MSDDKQEAESVEIDGSIIRKRKLSDYTPNPKNHNKGTERGKKMIEKSFEKYRAGRSLLADSNDMLIAGNQSQGGALDAGIEDVIEIETDGKTAVVVKRKDLDLESSDDLTAVELSYMDNRAHEVSYVLDTDQLAADDAAGVDFSDMYTPGELAALIPDDDELSKDLPDGQEVPEQYVLIVECGSEKEQAKLFEELEARGLKCRAILS